MIYRGTTPTYTLTFEDENLDFGDAHEIILTIADTNDNAILELSGNQLDVGTKTISFSLSQQQTLASSGPGQLDLFIWIRNQTSVQQYREH